MQTRSYRELRSLELIQDADLLLFGGKAIWPSIPLRWWDNGYNWHELYGWLPWVWGDWSHTEVAHWDRGSRMQTLEAWGSVGGGPRKIPLSQLLYRYGSFGWAPFILGDGERQEVMARAGHLWRPHLVNYPGLRQYWRTAFRYLYKEWVDIDPYLYSCWKWVGAVNGLPSPASLYASDLIKCGRFGEVTRVVP